MPETGVSFSVIYQGSTVPGLSREVTLSLGYDRPYFSIFKAERRWTIGGTCMSPYPSSWAFAGKAARPLKRRETGPGMDAQTAVFETLSVPKALMAMAVPVVVSQIASLVYNIVDVWCIGRSNYPSMVGASSLVLVLYMLLVAIGNFFGNGGSNLAARQHGKGDTEQTRKTA